MKTIASAVAAVVATALVMSASAGVFNDAYFLLYGGVDKNDNGYIDQGDLVDYRHYGDSTAGTGKFEIYRGWDLFTAAEKQQAFTIGDETVRLATAGVTLENEPCIRWHQYVYKDGDVDKVKYSFLEKTSIVPDSESFTFIMRFRPTMFGYNGYKSQVINFGNTWGASGMFLYIKVNSDATGGCLAYGMGKTGIDYEATSLVVTNGVWHEVALVLDGANRKITVGLNQELGFDWRGPSYGQGYMMWSERTISSSVTGWQFKPTSDFIRLLGASLETSGKTLPNSNAFFGDVHMIGMWSRALSKKEIYEALSNRRPAVFEIGDADAAADTFFKGTAGQDVTIDAIPRTWHDFPSILQRGASATIRFSVPDNYADLPQTLRLMADSGSCSGVVSATLDGSVSLGERTVNGGGVSRFCIAEGVLSAGNHAVTLRRTDAGSGDLSLSAVSLSDSWQIGARDGSRAGFNAQNDATDFYCSDGNVHDFSSAANNKHGGGTRTMTFHFDVPSSDVEGYKYMFETRLISYNWNYPSLAYYSVNGGELRELLNMPTGNQGSPTFSFEIPASELLPGQDNTIYIANVVDNGDTPSYSGYLTFDYYKFTAKERKGFILMFR